MSGWLQRVLARIRPDGPIRLEPLGGQHAPRVSALHRASFARGWDQPEVAHMLGEGNILADGIFSGRDRQPFGFVMSRIAADEAEILTIALDPAWRGRGLSRRLLDAHLPSLARRGVARLFLEVEDGNVAALHLYRAAGFRDVGTREGYYAKPDGTRARALVMRLDL